MELAQRILTSSFDTYVDYLEKQRGYWNGDWRKRNSETDRRIIRNRCTFETKIRKIDVQKATQRQNRGQFVRTALVGYTNVGKSTIMNMLSNANVFAEDNYLPLWIRLCGKSFR